MICTNLEGSDDNVGGVDSDGGGSGVRLLDVDSLDVDDPLLTVDLGLVLLAAASSILAHSPDPGTSRAESLWPPGCKTTSRPEQNKQKHTWVILPSRPLYFPRTIKTSSSFRMGMDRVVCFSRSSLERGEDIILRLRPEGAAK